MKHLVVLLLCLFVLKLQYSVTLVAGKEYTLFSNFTNTPGPSMSFNISFDLGTLEFEFKTFVKDALVLYQDDMGYQDYIEVALVDGRIFFSFNTKGNEREIIHRSNKNYNDFEWHRVEILRKPSYTELYLDGVLQKKFYTEDVSRFKSMLQIGDFNPTRYDINPNDITKRQAYETRGFFNACVRKIRYAAVEEVGRPLENFEPENRFVSEGCTLTVCDKPEPICKHGGKCSIRDGKESCDCRWTGYEGETCTEPSLELSLNGTYRVTFSWNSEPIASENERFKFRIKTKQRQALIMDIPGFTGGTDKLTMELLNSKLVVVSNTGGGHGRGRDVKLMSSKISDGEWHTVEFERKKEKRSLKIDGKPETRGSSTKGEYYKMDYKQKIYIGENRDTDDPYEHNILLQDFVWECCRTESNNYLGNVTNFVRGLFDSYNKRNNKYKVEPNDVLPQFNRKLPTRPFSPKPTEPTGVTTHATDCVDREEVPCPKPDTTPDTTQPVAQKTGAEEDDDATVTWIIVVSVICSIVLFAAIAFLVYKWNQKYSGEFPVDKKHNGPSATVVHYKDSAYKEKQRLSKI